MNLFLMLFPLTRGRFETLHAVFVVVVVVVFLVVLVSVCVVELRHFVLVEVKFICCCSFLERFLF